MGWAPRSGDRDEEGRPATSEGWTEVEQPCREATHLCLSVYSCLLLLERNLPVSNHSREGCGFCRESGGAGERVKVPLEAWAGRPSAPASLRPAEARAPNTTHPLFRRVDGVQLLDFQNNRSS